MHSFEATDGARLVYRVAGSEDLPPLILLHGFTGSSEVFSKNTPALSARFHIIAPDLRGHGESDKTSHGFHVSRLAMDLKNLLDHLNLTANGSVRCIAGSLGCAILWSFAELFTPVIFSHMVWVDQAPMQNYALDGTWGPWYGNRSMNSAASVAELHGNLKRDPDGVYKGTIAGCLGYLSHPQEGVTIPDDVKASDEAFFLNIARKGNPMWYWNLMADHTSLDWRESIAHCFGDRKGRRTRVLVVASSRSGCFPARGPMEAVNLCNRNRPLRDAEGNSIEKAKGVVVDWGGHWCYWENPDKFNELALDFL